MKRRARAFWAAACVSVLPNYLQASTSGTSAFSFLNLPVGARATALGEAFTSVPNDVQALVYNPASLATLIASQVSFQQLSYVDDINQEEVSFGHAGRDEAVSWGVSANYLSVGDITRTVATESSSGDGFTEEGTFSTYDMALGASAAGYVQEDLRVGGTVKLLHESLADASSTAGAFDAGVNYRLSDEHAWNLGASVLNMGFASKFADAAVELPTAFRLGVSGQPFSQWLFTTDYAKRVDTGGEMDVGAEVSPNRYISMRAGYRYQFTSPDLGGLSNFSAGVGLRYQRMSFDYAFVPLGDLGVSHRFTISYRFKTPAD